MDTNPIPAMVIQVNRVGGTQDVVEIPVTEPCKKVKLWEKLTVEELDELLK